MSVGLWLVGIKFPGAAELPLLSALFVCEGPPVDPLHCAWPEDGVCGGMRYRVLFQRLMKDNKVGNESLYL